MKHKVLLIGLGNVGAGYDYESDDLSVVSTHAKAFFIHPDFDLVGGVDPSTSACTRFRQRYGGWAGCDLEEALTALNPNIVVIASPTEHHAEAVRSVLKHAKPRLILCEKPLSHSLEEAESIVASCREASCLLYVNYLRRVEPGVLEIKRRLQNGEIKRPLKGVLWYTKGLLHNGSHFFNLLEFWLGPMQKFSLISSGCRVLQTDIEVDVRVKFLEGEVTFLAADAEHFSHHEIHLICPNGCLRYERGGAEIIWQSTIDVPGFSGYKGLALPGEKIETEGARLQWLVADEVARCMRGGPTNLCTGDEALDTLRSLLEIKDATRL